MITQWFVRRRTAFAKIGFGALFSLSGVIFLAVTSSFFAFDITGRTLLWLFVFLFPVGFAIGVTLLAHVISEPKRFMAHLLVGYGTYVIYMISVFIFGLYSRTDIWSMIAVLVLAAVMLYTSEIQRSLTRTSDRAQNSTLHSKLKEDSSQQLSLFLEEERIIYLAGSSSDKDRRNS